MSQVIDTEDTPQDEVKSYEQIRQLLLSQNKNELKMIEIQENYLQRRVASEDKKTYRVQLGKIQKKIKEQKKLISYLENLDVSDLEE